MPNAQLVTGRSRASAAFGAYGECGFLQQQRAEPHPALVGCYDLDVGVRDESERRRHLREVRLRSNHNHCSRSCHGWLFFGLGASKSMCYCLTETVLSWATELHPSECKANAHFRCMPSNATAALQDSNSGPKRSSSRRGGQRAAVAGENNLPCGGVQSIAVFRTGATCEEHTSCGEGRYCDGRLCTSCTKLDTHLPHRTESHDGRGITPPSAHHWIRLPETCSACKSVCVGHRCSYRCPNKFE